MTYEEALEEIHGFNRFGSKLGLSRVTRLMELLGNLQDQIPVIHVAGTNGKGSVCRYLYCALEEQGYKVGLYTSPFVEVFNERIEFHGEMISNEDLALYTDEVMQVVRSMVAAGEESPTEFEVVTAIAFVYFKKKGADCVVLEVGLGGRGDSTNVVKKPIVSVITSISYDHTEYLGDTLPKIAAEKAGIIKEGCPVVFAIKDREAAAVVRDRALELGCEYYDLWGTSEIGGNAAGFQQTAAESDEAAADTACGTAPGGCFAAAQGLEIANGGIAGEGCAAAYNIKEELSGYGFDARIMDREYHGVKLSMAGMHQVENACCALSVIEVLKKGNKLKIDDSAVYGGLKKARQIGRFEILQENPYLIIDGAHNSDGAVRLAETVKKQFKGKRILLICGILADKEIDKMIAAFGSTGAELAATEPDNQRKLPSSELCARIRKAGFACEDAGCCSSAIQFGKERMGSYDLIIYAGSLYLIGKVREGFQGEHQ